MILNTHDPCPSDLMVRTAPVFWLVIAHSAPGTVALELSRTMARNEVETICANATLAAQARITINNMVNFFMEPPIMLATPAGCPESRRGPQAITKRRLAGKKAKTVYLP